MEVIFMLLMISTVPTCLCQKNEGVCGISGNDLTCCPDYYNVKGACITCPKGFYGKGCLTHCPIGRYGVSCKSICSCNSHQTCNSEEGCVVNIAKSCNIDCGTVCTNGFFTSTCKEICGCTKDPGSKFSVVRLDFTANITDIRTTDDTTFLINTNTEQTTGHDLLVTTQLNIEDRTFPWEYITLVSLASLMLTVVICLICYLVRNKQRKKRMRNDIEQAVDNPAPEASLEVIPHLAAVDQAVYVSDYSEICDVEAAYADSRELSGVYNDLSFYKSDARMHNFKSTNTVYNIAKNCGMQSQQAPNESREDLMDDAQCSVKNSFVDETAQKSTEKEVSTSTSEDDLSV